MDANPNSPQKKFAFGEYVFVPLSGELFDGHKMLLLRPQVAKLLDLLLTNANSIVSRDEIRNCLWSSKTVVEFEEGISACMRQLRVALNDGTTGTRYIQTISKRGYKFVFPVTVSDSLPAGAQAISTALPGQALSRAPAAKRRNYRWTLSMMAMGLILMVIAVGTIAHFKYGIRFFTHTQTIRKHPVIAVLPFANLSVNPSDTLFGASLASGIIDLLGPVSPAGLSVIGDTSSMHFVNRRKTIKEIGEELGASYVLEGSITQGPRFIHVSARLIRVADQSYVWGSEYDLDIKDQSRGYQQIMVQIAAHIAELLAPDASVSPRDFTLSRAAALDLKLGRYLLARGHVDRAEYYCHMAMIRDPRFAAAYVCFAESLLAPKILSVRQLQAAKALAGKALQLNHNSSAAHRLLASLYLFYQWNPVAAESQIHQALRRDPGNVLAWETQAAYYVAMGHNRAMREALSVARSLDPVLTDISADPPLFLYIGHQYDEAEKYARLSLRLKSDDGVVRHVLILALLGEGKYAQATRQAALEMQYAHAPPGAIKQVQTDGERALVDYFRWYVMTLTTQPSDKFTAVFLADAYMHLGQPNAALGVIATAVHQRAPNILIPFISVWPSLHPLCGKTEFVTMVRQIGQPGCVLNK